MNVHLAVNKWFPRPHVRFLRATSLGFAWLAVTAHGPPARADEVLRLDIAHTNFNLVLTWTNVGAALESALVVTGAWNELTGAVSPLVIAPSNFASFFRLRWQRPKFFCMNDNFGDTPGPRAVALAQHALDAWFASPSPFEAH